MDSVDIVIHKLQQKQASHPVLSGYWVSYLETLKQTMDQMADRANRAMELMDTIEDIHPTQLAALIALNNIA